MRRGSSSSKLDRNLIERNRRQHMKELYSGLASVIPAYPSKEKLALHVLLDQATAYIKKLQERTEELKGRRELLKSDEINCMRGKVSGGPRLPVIELRDLGTALEVNLVIGPNENFMLHEVISILKEEGADVVTANYASVGDTVFYTIYSQALCSRIGIETSRAHDRLKKLVIV